MPSYRGNPTIRQPTEPTIVEEVGSRVFVFKAPQMIATRARRELRYGILNSYKLEHVPVA